MLYEAKLISDSFEDDPEKRGFILVEFDRKLRWAQPQFDFGSIRVPSKEWVEKYKDAIGIYVSEVGNQPHLVWTGFFVYKDRVPAIAKKEYPYARVLLFSENWTIYASDSKGKHNFSIEHSKGSMIRINQTKGKESIELIDATNNNSIVMNSQGINIDALTSIINVSKNLAIPAEGSFGHMCAIPICPFTGQIHVGYQTGPKLG